MSKLVLYTAPGCHLCAQAMASLSELQGELRFELEEVDITREDALHRAYLERIPVGVLDGAELFEYFLDERTLRRSLLETSRPATGDSPRPSIL